ncbi:MAG: UbiA family prenyltransferase [Bacteroidetes bacterium]|nr:UbiA family prenyltransferase [Bacteroidota bacterium]
MIKQLKSIFNLVRFPNLVIIAATQYAMRYLIMEPLLPTSEFELQFGDMQFFLLVLSTVFIAAAGYIINDYFDTRTDMINKPARVVVGVEVGRRQAMILHAILNIIGIGIGIYLGFYIHLPALSIVFMLATGLLWFYSTSYKRQFLVGNLSVCFLTGLVPLMVVLFEIPLLNRVYGEQMLLHNVSFNYMAAWVGGFSFFAFLTTLIRELIKDAEDFEGDSASGMRTVPIVLGTRWTKVILLGLISVTLAMLIFLLIRFILFSVEPADFISLTYFIVLLIAPFVLLFIQIMAAKEKRDYHRASTLIKLIMLFGILYSALVFFLVNFKY